MLEAFRTRTPFHPLKKQTSKAQIRDVGVKSHEPDMRFMGGGAPYIYIYICMCMYIYICIHRRKESEGIMKGGGVHEGVPCVYMYISICLYVHIYSLHRPPLFCFHLLGLLTASVTSPNQVLLQAAPPLSPWRCP